MKAFYYFITILTMVIIPLSLFAQEIKPLEIKPVPDLPSEDVVTLTRCLGEYDGYGTIDFIYEGRIVINDQGFSFTKNIQMINTRGEAVNISRLTPGVKVCYLLESAGIIKTLVLNN